MTGKEYIEYSINTGDRFLVNLHKDIRELLAAILEQYAALHQPPDEHLYKMMPKEMADLFMTEIIKSLNQITFNGERKITAVRKYGNAIAVTVEPFGRLPKEAYNFSLGSKQTEVVLDGQ